MAILIQLAHVSAYRDEAWNKLREQLQACPTNQLPMYAEQVQAAGLELPVDELQEVLTKRLPEVEKLSKRKRIEKVLKRLGA